MALKTSQVPDLFMGSDSDLMTVEEGWSYEEVETEQIYSGIVMLHDVLVPINPVPVKKRVVSRVGQIDTGQSSTLQWALLSCLQNSVYVSVQWVPHTNDSSTPLRNFVLCFVETITVLVVETNHYCQCYLDTPDERHSAAGDIAETKLFVLLGTTIHHWTNFTCHLVAAW